jgi:hypothetical protein
LPLKLTVVSDMMRRSLVDTDISEECFVSIVTLFYPDDGARSSKTLVNIYQTTWRHIPDDSSLHCHLQENHLLNLLLLHSYP